MKLKLSCTDFSFPLLEHDRALAVIALLGFRGVDIGLFEGHGHMKPSHELKTPAQSGAKLKRRLAAHGLKAADIFLQIHASFTEFAVNHPEAKRRVFAREQFVRALDYANSAGADHVTILPGVVFETESRADSVKRSAEELAWRVAQAKAATLQVAVEPHIGSLIDTPERALDLVKRVPGLGLTLDYAHFTRAGISDARIEPLVKFATHLHARTARRGRLQCPMKENTIDFPRMVKALGKHKFTGWAALEFVWIDWEHCNEVDIISETIQLKKMLADAAAKIK
ncbi:MAG TPA: sugar phosphate isomerase/epimerase family protein [Verrucomicrobiae bacterium]|jgi:sugar phosphate isomerase/epimerase